MGDSLPISNAHRGLEARAICSKKQSLSYLVASASKGLSQKTLTCITKMKQGIQGNATAGDIMVFLVTTAALEIVRRFSRAKCPFVWRALQALQVLCYPPFKWIERWHPFKGLIKHTKKLSRPMFVLSIATVFSEQSAFPTEPSNGFNSSQESSGSRSEPSSQMLSLDARSHDEVAEASTSEEWLLDLHTELKRQGIALPERLNDELHHFYAAVNGDFSKLVSSVKKTVFWRQSYELFLPQELDAWSHLVFWHGHDVRQRPCLIIRLGIVCSNLGSNDRPLFVKAVVSTIEDGILNLVTVNQPQIMVLMDCEGLTPFGFPIQMMRSCAILLQDHYPNRLGCLMIVRLPQIARVITQTLFQVLKPATQRKLRTVGGNYEKILSECLETIPSFIGGNCSCSKCSNFGSSQRPDRESTLISTVAEHLENVPATNTSEDWDQLKRTLIFGVLMFWIFVIFVLRIYPEKPATLYWQNN